MMSDVRESVEAYQRFEAARTAAIMSGRADLVAECRPNDYTNPRETLRSAELIERALGVERNGLQSMTNKTPSAIEQIVGAFFAIASQPIVVIGGLTAIGIVLYLVTRSN